MIPRPAMLVLNISLFLLSIFCIVGLIYLTQFSFNAKINTNVACVDDMNQTKLNFAKTAVIVTWTMIILNIVLSIWTVS